MATNSLHDTSGSAGLVQLACGVWLEMDSLPIEALGEVEELDAWLGLLAGQVSSSASKDFIARLRRDLSDLQDQINWPGTPLLSAAHVSRLDIEIERLRLSSAIEGFGDLSGFTNVARTVCRRAQRRLYALSQIDAAPTMSDGMGGGHEVAYLDRLADLLLALSTMRDESAASSSRSSPPTT